MKTSKFSLKRVYQPVEHNWLVSLCEFQINFEVFQLRENLIFSKNAQHEPYQD